MQGFCKTCGGPDGFSQGGAGGGGGGGGHGHGHGHGYGHAERQMDPSRYCPLAFMLMEKHCMPPQPKNKIYTEHIYDQ
ncbi:unnamed protein product [Gadus morhua 'NCC']